MSTTSKIWLNEVQRQRDDVANSSVSEVTRLTMRAGRYSSKNDISRHDRFEGIVAQMEHDVADQLGRCASGGRS